jgi:Xaa-Pro aminopeptidase
MSYPTISAKTFSDRRLQLMDQLDDHSAIIVAGAPMQHRNNDVEYPFRQESDFFYLTGFDEPEALMLMTKVDGVLTYHLFCQPKDPTMEIWNGYRLGPEGAEESLGADEGHSCEDIDDLLPELLDGITHVYWVMGAAVGLESQVDGWLTQMRANRRQGVKVPTQMIDLAPFLHEMRLIKSEEEIAVMRAAGKISAEAHVEAMKACDRVKRMGGIAQNHQP